VQLSYLRVATAAVVMPAAFLKPCSRAGLERSGRGVECCLFQVSALITHPSQSLVLLFAPPAAFKAWPGQVLPWNVVPPPYCRYHPPPPRPPLSMHAFSHAPLLLPPPPTPWFSNSNLDTILP
jgi:hypothetical protein